MLDLNTLRNRAYQNACDHGFHDRELSDNHCFMLVITELSEAVEADRKGRRADKAEFELVVSSNSDHMSEAFVDAFERLVKDTVEDELADTVICMLDMAGLRGINLNGIFIVAYIVSRKKSFTENCYAIIKDIVNYKYTTEECLNYAIRQVFELAEFYDMDLEWHIEQKMKYNEHRGKMHGKKY